MPRQLSSLSQAMETSTRLRESNTSLQLKVRWFKTACSSVSWRSLIPTMLQTTVDKRATINIRPEKSIESILSMIWKVWQNYHWVSAQLGYTKRLCHSSEKRYHFEAYKNDHLRMTTFEIYFVHCRLISQWGQPNLFHRPEYMSIYHRYYGALRMHSAGNVRWGLVLLKENDHRSSCRNSLGGLRATLLWQNSWIGRAINQHMHQCFTNKMKW